MPEYPQIPNPNVGPQALRNRFRWRPFQGGVNGRPLGTAALVVGDKAALTFADSLLRDRLSGLGFQVFLVDDDDTADLTRDVVVIAESISSSSVNTKYRNALMPVVNFDHALNDDFDFIDAASVAGGADDNIVILDPTNPLSAGRTGTVSVTIPATRIDSSDIAHLAASALIAYRTQDNSALISGYGFAKGAKLFNGHIAEARRAFVGLLPDASSTAIDLANVPALIDAAILWVFDFASETATFNWQLIDPVTRATNWLFVFDDDQAIQPPAAAAFDPAPYTSLFSTEEAWRWGSFRIERDQEWHSVFDDPLFDCNVFDEDVFATDDCTEIKVAGTGESAPEPAAWTRTPNWPEVDYWPPAAPVAGFDPSPYVAAWDLIDPVRRLTWLNPEIEDWAEALPSNLDQLWASSQADDAVSVWKRWLPPEVEDYPDNVPPDQGQITLGAQPDDALKIWPKWTAPEIDDWVENLPVDLDQTASSAQFFEQIPIWKAWSIVPDEDQSIQPPIISGFDPAPYVGAWDEFAPPQLPLWTRNEVDDWAENIPADLDRLAASAQFDDNIRVFPTWKQQIDLDDGQPIPPDDQRAAGLPATEEALPLKPWRLDEVDDPVRLPDDLATTAGAAQDILTPLPRQWSSPYGPDVDDGIQPPVVAGFDPSPYAALFDPEAASIFKAWTGGEVDDWAENLPGNLDQVAGAAQSEHLTWSWARYRFAHDDEQVLPFIGPEFSASLDNIDPVIWKQWITDLPPDISPFYTNVEKFLAALELSEAFPWKKWVTDLPPDEVFKEFDSSPFATLFGVEERRLWPLWLAYPEIDVWAVNVLEVPPPSGVKWLSARDDFGLTRPERQTLQKGYGVTKPERQSLGSGFGVTKKDEADT